jgi:hypothetical protein
MKRLYLLASLLVLALCAAPLDTIAQPDPEPKVVPAKAVAKTPAKKVVRKRVVRKAPVKAPAKKEEPKAAAPKIETKGEVIVTDPAPKAEEKGEEKPAEAKKEDLEEQAWWKTGLNELVKLIFLILGLMATTLVTVLARKYKFEDQATKVNGLLMSAVGFADQAARKAMKLEDKTLKPNEKMELAVSFAQKMAKDYKVKDKGADWWEDKLESWLGVQNGKPVEKPEPKPEEG